MKFELDKFAHIESPLQRWDTRWKLGACALFVVATVSLRTPWVAAAALLIAAGLIAVGRLPASEVGLRIRPVIIVVVVIACVLAISSPGERFDLAGVPLSQDGVRAGALVAAKALAVVLALVALVSSSPTQRTWAAMRQLYVPAGLVQVFHLAYRYVFVIHAESRAVQVAMRARGFRPELRGRSLAVLGNAVGMLLIRSTERAERVYLAMQARGYDGSFPLTEPWRTRTSDIMKFTGLGLLSVLLIAGDFALTAC